MKGFFTQGGVLLLNQSVRLSELEPLLHSFGEVRRTGDGKGHWAMVSETDLFPQHLLGQLPNFHYVASISGGRIIKGRLPA